MNRQLMEDVRAFYETVVGLEPGYRPPFRTPGYWLYAAGRDVLHLSEEMPDDRRRTGSDLSFDHVALASSDAPLHLHKLRAAGVDFTENVVPVTGQRQIFFRDPAGNGVELIFPADDAPSAP